MSSILSPESVAQIREREKKYGDVNLGDVPALCNSHEALRAELEKSRDEERKCKELLAKQFTEQGRIVVEESRRAGLEMLVQIAIKHEEISLSRAAEILGVSLDEIRKLSVKWHNEEQPPSEEKKTPMEAFQELAKAANGAWDGVDADQYVKEIRGAKTAEEIRLETIEECAKVAEQHDTDCGECSAALTIAEEIRSLSAQKGTK